MKKILIFGALLAIGASFAFGKKETDGGNAVLPTLSPYEGKFVSTDDRQYYVIKDGKRWVVVNEQAQTDFANFAGVENFVLDIPAASVANLPIGGALLPGLIYQPA